MLSVVVIGAVVRGVSKPMIKVGIVRELVVIVTT